MNKEPIALIESDRISRNQKIKNKGLDNFSQASLAGLRNATPKQLKETQIHKNPLMT